jgi:hypothetical protein
MRYSSLTIAMAAVVWAGVLVATPAPAMSQLSALRAIGEAQVGVVEEVGYRRYRRRHARRYYRPYYNYRPYAHYRPYYHPYYSYRPYYRPGLNFWFGF